MEGNVIQPNGAVSGGGEVYSTTETIIGEFLGKTLYRKVINFGALPNAVRKTVNHGITVTNAFKLINFYGVMNPNIGLPQSGSYSASILSSAYVTGFYFKDTEIVIDTNYDMSFMSAYVVVEYTKS